VNVRNLRNRLVLSLVFGIVVYAGLSFYGDLSDVLASLGDFNWALLPLILALTSVNYLLRFVKWQYYLRIIEVKGFAAWDSFLVFFSGLGMVVTPGKVGEWLKCYLLREMHGTPISRSAPIPIAERLTDSVALLVIAGAGVFVFGNLWQVFVAVSAGAVLIVAVSRHRPTAFALLALGKRVPFVKRFIPQLEEFYESTYVLMSPSAVVAMSAFSVASWFFEVLAFYFTLVGLGLDGDADLLLHAAFILPIATLASAILLTPGGLGVAEGSITALCQTLLNMTKSSAAVAALIIRLGTLWFGVLVGLLAFFIVTRKLPSDEDASLQRDIAAAGAAEPLREAQT
jgi:uncharacterized protein (TIRG00374 family)